MDLFSELNSLMVRYRFRPNRKLAQLFIVDPEIIQGMVKLAELKKTDIVLEIGAGTGFLTRALQEKCKVIAVELDDSLFELLQSGLQKQNLELLHGNFLELDIAGFNKVVALPPYTVSSEILYKLFGNGFEKAVLVFQLEFAEKLAAEPGFLEYNALSVLTQYFCSVKIVQTVSSKSFFPSPKCLSAIIVLDWKKRSKKVKDVVVFKKFVKSLFRFQNKNLRNALLNSFQFIGKEMKISRKDFDKKIENLHLKDVKVKLIDCEAFVEIFNSLCKK